MDIAVDCVAVLYSALSNRSLPLLPGRRVIFFLLINYKFKSPALFVLMLKLVGLTLQSFLSYNFVVLVYCRGSYRYIGSLRSFIGTRIIIYDL